MNNIQLIQHIKFKFFDRNKLNHHSLILYIGRDEISYSIINDNDNTAVCLKSYRIKEIGNFFAYKLLVKDFFEQEDLLHTAFKSVTVGLNFANYTLIPARYFEEEHIEKFYSFNYPYDGSAKLCHDHISSAKVANIYAIDAYLIETIQERFPNSQIKHAISYLLEDMLSENIYNKNKILYLNIQKHHVDIVGLNGNNLVFLNSYYYQIQEDLLYYALNAAQQIGFDYAQDECLLSGEVVADYPQYQILKTHFQHLKFVERPSYCAYCEELNVLPSNYHYNLFCIH